MIRRRGPETVTIGDATFTLPAGLSRRDRREAIRACEDHVVLHGELTVAEFTAIVRRRAPAMRKAIKASRPRAPKKRSAYRNRERDFDRMAYVKTLPCTMTIDPIGELTPCRGPIEADHAGRRGLGRKADDDTVIPLCDGHHDDRTDHTGAFKNVSRDDERDWRERAIERTRRAWDARLALAATLPY